MVCSCRADMLRFRCSWCWGHVLHAAMALCRPSVATSALEALKSSLKSISLHIVGLLTRWIRCLTRAPVQALPKHYFVQQHSMSSTSRQDHQQMWAQKLPAVAHGLPRLHKLGS